MERKPLPGISRTDFQDWHHNEREIGRAVDGRKKQNRNSWENQNASSSTNQQQRFQTPLQQPSHVHLQSPTANPPDEIHSHSPQPQHSPRSSNPSTTATGTPSTSSFLNASLSHLRHDPGAGPRTVLHDINARVFPLLFFAFFLVALTSVLIYTFALNRALPHRLTAIVAIILASILFIWGLFAIYEYYRNRRRAGKIWEMKIEDIEKALRENGNGAVQFVKEFHRNNPTPIESKSKFGFKRDSNFLPFHFRLFRHPLAEDEIGEKEKERQETAAAAQPAPASRKKVRLSSLQIGSLGAGKDYLQDAEKQWRVRENEKIKEKISLRESSIQNWKMRREEGDLPVELAANMEDEDPRTDIQTRLHALLREGNVSAQESQQRHHTVPPMLHPPRESRRSVIPRTNSVPAPGVNGHLSTRETNSPHHLTKGTRERKLAPSTFEEMGHGPPVPEKTPAKWWEPRKSLFSTTAAEITKPLPPIPAFTATSTPRAFQTPLQSFRPISWGRTRSESRSKPLAPTPTQDLRIRKPIPISRVGFDQLEVNRKPGNSKPSGKRNTSLT